AIHFRHHDIESDGGRFYISGQPQAFRAVVSRYNMKTFLHKEPAEKIADSRIIINHQDGGGAGRWSNGSRFEAPQDHGGIQLHHCHSCRYSDAERCALPINALNGDVTAHHLAKSLTDHKTESGASIFP